MFGTNGQASTKSFSWNYHNWTKLKDIIDALPKGTGQPFIIDIDDGFDQFARETITIPSGLTLKIISTHSGGYKFRRLGSWGNGENAKDPGPYFKVESGGELCLGGGLNFTGEAGGQLQAPVREEWYEVTTTATTVPSDAVIGFGGIGGRFTVNGMNFYGYHPIGSGDYLNFSVADNSTKSPNIYLYSSSDGYNKEIKNANANNLSTSAYYMLAYNTGVRGIWPINFTDLQDDKPAVKYGTKTKWMTLSLTEKLPWLWTIQIDDKGNRYFKNAYNGLVLTATNDGSGNVKLKGTQLTTSKWEKRTTGGNYTEFTWPFGSEPTDKFKGGAYFVESTGTLTVDGASFRDLIQVTVPDTGDNWTVTFEQLPVLAGGNSYYITETQETGYVRTYSKTTHSVTGAYNGETITNKYTPDSVSITVNKSWNGEKASADAFMKSLTLTDGTNSWKVQHPCGHKR